MRLGSISKGNAWPSRGSPSGRAFSSVSGAGAAGNTAAGNTTTGTGTGAFTDEGLFFAAAVLVSVLVLALVLALFFGAATAFFGLAGALRDAVFAMVTGL